MEYMVLVFSSMIFLHVFADYNLQRGGYLADLKQKKFWETFGDKYEKDWMAAMFMHCFVWAFAIMLPLIIIYGGCLWWAWLLLPINIVIHFIIDDMKANKMKINLIQDQALHMVQIVATFLICLAMLG